MELAKPKAPPRLDQLAIELLDHILAYLPAAEAYFLRHASRGLTSSAARRVELAVAEMVARDDSHAFIEFYAIVATQAIARTRASLRLRWESKAALLRRAKLRPNSAMALEIIATMRWTGLSLMENARIFAALDPSDENLRAAADFIFLSMANDALHQPEELATAVAVFLTNIGGTHHDLLSIVARLRKPPFMVRWIIEFVVRDAEKDHPDNWFAPFCKRFFEALSSSDEFRRENPTDEDVVDSLKSLARFVSPLQAADLLRHCPLNWSGRGQLFSSMAHEVDAEERSLGAIHYFRILADIIGQGPGIWPGGFIYFFLEAHKVCPTWYELVPYFLDEDLWPAEKKVQADCFLDDRIWKSLGYRVPENEEDYGYGEHGQAHSDFGSYSEQDAEEAEAVGIKTVVRAILDHPGRISSRRLGHFFDSASNPRTWTALGLEEATSLDEPAVSEQRIADVISSLPPLPVYETADMLRQILKTRGEEGVKDCYMPFVLSSDALPRAANEWKGCSGYLGKLAARLLFADFSSNDGLPLFDGEDTRPFMSESSQRLLALIFERIRSRVVGPANSNLSAESKTGLQLFIGHTIVACFGCLKDTAKTIRNLGLIFAPGQHAQRSLTPSYAIGGVAVSEIKDLLDLLKSVDDVKDFAAGLLARRPGKAAAVVAESTVAELKGQTLKNKDKAALLERFLSMGRLFGGLDTRGDGDHVLARDERDAASPTGSWESDESHEHSCDDDY